MSSEIQHVHVDYDDPAEQHIRAVTVTFAGRHRLCVEADRTTVRVRLHNGQSGATLPAGGNLSTYDRAINLIRLHIPDAGT